MSVPQPITRDAFLANLRRSSLLSAEQIAAVEEQAQGTNRGRVLARTLVQQGMLTRFQAEQLLAGRTNGFQLGQYRILEQIGQGGMGRVFKAEHRAMGRVVAVKVLAPSLMKTGRASELFLREVRAASKLVHPNIVSALDANEVGGRCFLVMEYIDGPNLDQLVADQGPLPVGQACDFIRQASDGLQCAFNFGMVHRDIKPANLLLQRKGPGPATRGVVKLTDFGIARLNESGSLAGLDGDGTILTKENTVMGTPDYLSPEQARNLHNTDIRSDLYSLGCTFYYLLTGRVPFPGGTMLEKLVRHGVKEPVSVERLRSDVPAGVVAIVRRLMAKDPAARFQTPAELSEALAPFAVSGPMAWADRKTSDPFVDPGATPVNAPGSGPELSIHPSSWDETSALVGTLPPDLSATPLSALPTGRTTRTFAALEAEERRRLKKAVLWTVCIVGGWLAALGLLALYAHAH